MDLVLELLEEPAYRHVLTNHVPLVGLVIAWFVLLAATIEGRTRSILFGGVLVLALSASGEFVLRSGDAAYPFVYDLLDGTGRAWLDHHTELADRWGISLRLNTAVAAVSIAVCLFRDQLARIAACCVLISSLATLVALATIAEAGGKIRHSEFRLTDPPPASDSGRLR